MWLQEVAAGGEEQIRPGVPEEQQEAALEESSVAW